MINELNKVLRQLLIHDLPIKNGEVEVAFNQPVREWSAKISRPTINLFLYDIRENTTLRDTQWDLTSNGNGTVTRRRKPIRLNLTYIISAWSPTNTVDDMYNLLERTIKVLFRHPVLPLPEEKQTAESKIFWQKLSEKWPEVLSQQPVPIPVQAAQSDVLRNPAELWSAMDNELRPSVPCTVTVALNPFWPDTVPLVYSRDLRFGQAEALPKKKQLAQDEANQIDRFWMVGGAVCSDNILQKVKLILLEYGQDVPVRADGRFVIGNLEAGQYTLELSAEDRKPSRHPITVPAQPGSNYDINI